MTFPFRYHITSSRQSTRQPSHHQRPLAEPAGVAHVPAEAVEDGGGGVPLAPAAEGHHYCRGVVLAGVEQGLVD